MFYLEDSKYNANVLEDALKDTLGLDPMFRPVKSGLSGIRFAVTVTIISDITLCLISNYNGEGQYRKDSSRLTDLPANS